MPWLNTRTLRKHRMLYPQWMELNFLHKLSLLTGLSAVVPLPMEQWKERIRGLHIYYFFIFSFWEIIERWPIVYRKKKRKKERLAKNFIWMREFPLAMVKMHLGDFKKEEKRNGEIYFIFLWLYQVSGGWRY